MNYQEVCGHFKKKIGVSKLSLLLTTLTVIFITSTISSWYFNSQFKILYSLDKRNNDAEIIALIDQAHSYIYFAIYTFTKDSIADALIRAKKRGVSIWGITDWKESTNDFEQPIIKRLQKADIIIETQKHYDGIMHIKAIVSDNAYALGSYNWTNSATYSNDELLEIGHSSNLRNQYENIIKQILITNQ